jgi:hypothetical protein
MKATLEADFSEFHAEATKADADMGKLTQSAAAVEQSLGNVTSAQGKSASATNSAVTAMRQFDGVLASVGLNINSQIRAIDDLAAAAGKTTSQIGALGSAGLVVGAAFAGWEIGRTIANVFGLDQAIVHLTGSSQELKNQVAAAQLETIARAMAQGASSTISYAGAVEFLNQKHKAGIEAQKDFTAGLKAITEAGQGWQQTLDTIDGSVVEAIKFYLEAGVSQKDLAAAYGLTAAQIRAVAEARQQDIETIKLWDQIHKTTFELAQQHEKEWAQETKRALEERNKAVLDGNAEIRRANDDLADFLAKSALSSTEYQVKKIWDVAHEQEAAFRGTEEQRRIFNANVEALADEQAERLKAKEREVVAAAAQAALDAANALASIIPDIGHGPTAPNGGGLPPIVVKPINVPSVFFNQNTNTTLRQFAEGGPTGTGGPALLHPDEFVVPRGGALVSGGGGTQIIQVMLDGRVLAQAVNDHNTKTMRRGRQLPAA